MVALWKEPGALPHPSSGRQHLECKPSPDVATEVNPPTGAVLHGLEHLNQINEVDVKHLVGPESVQLGEGLRGQQGVTRRPEGAGAAVPHGHVMGQQGLGRALANPVGPALGRQRVPFTEEDATLPTLSHARSRSSAIHMGTEQRHSAGLGGCYSARLVPPAGFEPAIFTLKG